MGRRTRHFGFIFVGSANKEPLSIDMPAVLSVHFELLGCYHAFFSFFFFFFFFFFFILFGSTAPMGHGLLIHEVSRSHTTTHHSRQDSSGRVICSSQRPLPDNTQHRHPCPLWDSNPHSQHAIGLRLRGHWHRHSCFCWTEIIGFIWTKIDRCVWPLTFVYSSPSAITTSSDLRVSSYFII